MMGTASLLITTTMHGVYAGGMSYFMRATALDQKVFDFVTPKFSHAFGLGLVAGLTHLTLSAVNRKLTSTTFTPQTGMYAAGYDKKSDFPKVYEICRAIIPIISAFSSTYLLRQMNYSIPYGFTAVCLIPYVMIIVAQSLQQDFE